MRSSCAVALLLACSGGTDDKPAPRTTSPEPPRLLEHAAPRQPPPGWTGAYDRGHDRWRHTSPARPDGRSVEVVLDRAPPPIVASPEALRHYLSMKVWDRDTTAQIEDREAFSGGFTTTLAVTAAGEAHREVHVLHQLGREWFHCRATWVPDAAARADVLALCKSLRRSR